MYRTDLCLHFVMILAQAVHFKKICRVPAQLEKIPGKLIFQRLFTDIVIVEEY